MFSRSKKIIRLILLILSFYLALFLVNKADAASSLTQIDYQPTNDDIANPERGFMKQANIFVDQTFDPSKISIKDPTDSVVWIYFHLENYRDPRDGKGVNVPNYQFKPLEAVGSGKGLDTINRAFSDARNKGLKLVIRFLYIGYGGIGSTTDFANAEPDAPLDVALKHIDQLAPLIQQNKDVIMAVQAGFVGYWGEWHSSKYLSPLVNRKAIVDKLLTAVPGDRMLQVRYPKYVQNFYGGPISESEAFSQSTISRVGIHDDAFLKDDTDDGTFTSNAMGQKISTYCDGSTNITQCWRDYLAKTSQYTPSGGEAGTHSNPPSPLADCPNALIQLNNLHFSFLHNGYAKVVLDTWVNQGCMPEIRQRLGYRFALKQLSLSKQVAPGGTMEFHLELENKGFASPFNSRPAIIVLKGTNSSFQKEIPLTSVDVRRWLPGRITRVDANVPIPQDVPNGTYSVNLWLPDASPGLRSRPEYAVRAANLNVWQPTTGYNLLFNNLLVGGTPVTPTPTPTGSPTSAKLKFKIQLPDILSSTTIIPASDVRIELRDGTNSVGVAGVDLVRNGNYFQTQSDASFDISQNKTYDVLIKTKISLRSMFAGVNLAQSQTLDCTVASNTACGELISQRDSKLILTGDSDGFQITSGSYNKIDSADLQVLATYFNQAATGLASAADFNFDATVNISDLEILGKNYGIAGD